MGKGLGAVFGVGMLQARLSKADVKRTAHKGVSQGKATAPVHCVHKLSGREEAEGGIPMATIWLMHLHEKRTSVFLLGPLGVGGLDLWVASYLVPLK